MSSYDWLTVGVPDDYDQLSAMLDPVFEPTIVCGDLKTAISPAVCGILIERDYVDKDYRSTFYNFYAKKGRPYRADCVRLHFFDSAVTFNASLPDLITADGRPQDHYFGYIVLRPTMVATIGRSILSPDIRKGAQGMTIQARHPVHLLGYKLYVWGFPSMSQYTDIAVCAHVSCWAILRHYSERFPQHRELLIHDITKLSQPFDPGGLTPSLGLNVLQAERIFQAAGSYPVLVHKKAAGPDRFLAQLLAYLESGFPLFVAMAAKGHAIVAIGHSWKPGATAPSANSLSSAQLESIVAVDDNMLPYSSVPVAGPDHYSVDDFSSFIVPLPDKIYYPADAVERQSLELYSFLAKFMTMPPADDLIRRYYVTTLSGLRRHVRDNQSQLGEVLVGAVMRLRAAQFVWVVEFASASQWNSGHVAARAVLDATASLHDPAPVWFAHDEQTAIFFDRGESGSTAVVVALARPAGAPLGRMEQNLRPVRSRS